MLAIRLVLQYSCEASQSVCYRNRAALPVAGISCGDVPKFRRVGGTERRSYSTQAKPGSSITYGCMLTPYFVP